MNKSGVVLIVMLLMLGGCRQTPTAAPPPAAATATQAASAASAPVAYFDSSNREDFASGGARRIQIQTPKGKFHVWTKRVGNSPRIKVLLLHGGPGATHEVFEAFDSYLPAAGVEYYYYDQLGSARSDQPNDASLWEVDRFVDEVEQVRQALNLDQDNFYLLGQSWGGLLAIEYALKYQQHLKGLVVSNMMSSLPDYNTYARKVLMPRMDPKVLAEIQTLEARKDFANPRYEELLMSGFYVEHVLRMLPDQWPDPVIRSFTRINREVYVPMQGPSEMGVSGKLANWDRSADLKRITVPTLVIGARHDTMDPAHMEWMSKQFPRGRYLYCPDGSHLAMYDDQKTYMAGLLSFLHDVDSGTFQP